MTEIAINPTEPLNIRPITHKVGNIYLDETSGSLHILSQVAPRQVALIALSTNSNRLEDAVAVQNIYNISDEVFCERIRGNRKLHLCSSVNISFIL